MPLIVSSLGSERPWLYDLGSCAGQAGDVLRALDFMDALLKASAVGHLFINVIVSADVPHYYLVHRGRVRAGHDAHYIVSIQESACVGTDERALVALIVRACAVALFDVAKQCRFDQDILNAWFVGLAGKDRFEMT